ncbi:uncharacterized protein [Spinacia oleracea]|uniref:Peptidase A2 domain-containing protein n=1 Tax=Spinacia oleracea TaxID=3562 RepID=A0ABM3RIX6_SPIOL|nr:uncharacterized protein LOC130470033 [Spinacia oleracea]
MAEQQSEESTQGARFAIKKGQPPVRGKADRHCDASASRPVSAGSLRHMLHGLHQNITDEWQERLQHVLQEEITKSFSETNPVQGSCRTVESAADRRGPPMERRPLKEERHHVREERPGRRTSLASQRPAYKPQGRHFTSRPTMTSRRPQANFTRKETGRDNEDRHDTQSCRILKKILDGYAARGYLRQYLCLTDANEASMITGQESCASPHSDNGDSYSDEGFIAVIPGGIAEGASSREGRQFSSSHLCTKQVVLPHVEISKDDYRKAAAPYDDDPLVLEIKVDNLRVKRVLVDTGSSSDIISLQCLQKLKHDPGTIEKVSKPLVGFGGSVVHPICSILLPVSIGTPPVTKEGAVRFTIVPSLTSFNIILGRPTLNDLKAVIVPYLLLVKFVGSNGGIGALYGNQQLAEIATYLHWNRQLGERLRKRVNS